MLWTLSLNEGQSKLLCSGVTSGNKAPNGQKRGIWDWDGGKCGGPAARDVLSGQTPSGMWRPSEQGTVILTCHFGSGPDDPKFLLAVQGVAQGIEGLPAHPTLQAPTVVGEGVKAELPQVHSQAAVPWNTQHRTLVGSWIWPSFGSKNSKLTSQLCKSSTMPHPAAFQAMDELL